MTMYAIRCNFSKLRIDGEFEKTVGKVAKEVKLLDGVVMEGEDPFTPWFYALFRTKRRALLFMKEARKITKGRMTFVSIGESLDIPDRFFTKAYLGKDIATA